MRFAIIENDVVINTFLADSLEIAESLVTDNQEVLDVTDSLIGIDWKRIDGILLPKKPDYDCIWHEPSFMWLTQEEIDLYNANQLIKETTDLSNTNQIIQEET